MGSEHKLSLALLGVILVLSAATSAAAKPATAVALLDEPDFRKPRIVVEESDPPGFQLVLEREMPTPGWTFERDEIRIDRDEGRIVVRLTEIGPAGIVAQVITTTELRVVLGPLDAGHYVVELRTRRDPSGEHRPAAAFVLIAR